jgi:hypothetical protein
VLQTVLNVIVFVESSNSILICPEFHFADVGGLHFSSQEYQDLIELQENDKGSEVRFLRETKRSQYGQVIDD